MSRNPRRQAKIQSQFLITNWKSFTMKEEKEENRVEIVDQSWKYLVVWVRKVSYRLVERLVEHFIYVRTKIYYLYEASHETFCLALSKVHHPHYLNHLSDGMSHTIQKFSDFFGRC